MSRSQDLEAVHVSRVVRSCRRMVGAGGPLPLAKLSDEEGCSARQLSRSFNFVLGLTPREFGQAVRTGRARSLLRKASSVSEAIFDAGFDSSRAFYESVPPTLGMAPATYRRGAPGETLRWTSRRLDFGTALLVASDRGLAAIHLGSSRTVLLAEAREEFPGAVLRRDDEALRAAAVTVEVLSRGGETDIQLPLDLRGTAFQARVWEALCRIPSGQVRSYGEVSRELGHPGAARAVGSACASNPVALIVPCHRVVKSDGGLGGYRWGLEIKKVLLEREGVTAAVVPGARTS